MLTHLTISHYALIDHLDIEFKEGFTVVTGETGAGKSIMLGALNLLLGGRADAKAIQTGERKCMVEATFTLADDRLRPFLAANDIDDDDAECIVRREVAQTGKSRAFINDTPVPAAKLKELGAFLIDIHSQHQNLLLDNEHFLIDTLDTAAACPDLVAQYRAAYTAWSGARKQLRQLLENEQKGREDEEYFRFQLAQIDDARLASGEQETLEEEQHLLSHAEDIKEALYGARSQMDNDTFSGVQNLRRAEELLHGVANNLPEAASLAERIHSLRVEMADVVDELDQRAERIEYDPARLNYVDDRLNTIYALQQKYRAESIDALLQHAEDLRGRLASLENLDEEKARLNQLTARCEADMRQAAELLTRSRQNAALQMQDELVRSLLGLGMPNARIEIKIEPRAVPDLSGADSVTLLFSANKNVPLQNVGRTASGGEVARLMLALKAFIARRTALPTIVFDEIDTGVSGTMAERMALVMQEISCTSQVVCITHLPQIAARGRHHFKVYKEDSAETTLSHIVPLDEAARVEEIAHMLSGERLTDAAVNNARALLQEQPKETAKP